MAGYLRLQHYTEVGTATAQRVEEAADVCAFGTLVVHVRVPKTATAGALVLQHAAVREEAAFTDLPVEPCALDAHTGHVRLVRAPLRYLRWRADGVSGTAGFQVDVIGRTGSSGGGVLPYDEPLALGAFVRKSEDEEAVNDNALSDDSELSVPVAANAYYAVEAWLLHENTSSAWLKWTFSVPAGATLYWITRQASNAALIFTPSTTQSSVGGVDRGASVMQPPRADRRGAPGVS